jgi:hypothetical protein
VGMWRQEVEQGCRGLELLDGASTVVQVTRNGCVFLKRTTDSTVGVRSAAEGVCHHSEAFSAFSESE